MPRAAAPAASLSSFSVLSSWQSQSTGDPDAAPGSQLCPLCGLLSWHSSDPRPSAVLGPCHPGAGSGKPVPCARPRRPLRETWRVVCTLRGRAGGAVRGDRGVRRGSQAASQVLGELLKVAGAEQSRQVGAPGRDVRVLSWEVALLRSRPRVSEIVCGPKCAHKECMQRYVCM